MSHHLLQLVIMVHGTVLLLERDAELFGVQCLECADRKQAFVLHLGWNRLYLVASFLFEINT